MPIPNSITSIEKDSFSKCFGLTHVSIPSSVKSIGDNAFEECICLESVIIPSSVISIGYEAFSKCSYLKEIIIGNSVTSIGNRAFVGCESLKQIEIPSSVTSIGHCSFEKCFSLRYVSIPSSVASFGEQIFDEIESLAIFGDLTMIPDSLFKNCSQLQDVEIFSEITSIGDYAFNECNKLKSIEIPSSVKSIGNYAFCGCASLMKIILPSSLTSLGDGAFLGCNQSIDITIQSSLQHVGTDAFLGCTEFNKKNYPANECEELVDINDYEFIKRIKRTNYSSLHMAENKKNGKVCLIKHYFFNQYNFHTITFKDQVFISRIDIPGIVRVEKYRFRLSEDDDYIAITDYYENNDVPQLTNEYLDSSGAQNEKMNPTIRSKIIFGVAATMKQLHKRNIIHRNLKLSKVLLDDNLEPKLINFQFSKVLTDDAELEYDLGTYNYMAPELFIGEGYSFPIDVYAFAIILYSLFTPFKIFKSFFTGPTFKFANRIIQGMRPCRTHFIPDPYWDLIQQCWDPNPEARPTFEQITEIIKDDKFALEEFGMKTDLNQLHEYQRSIDI